MSVGDLVDAVDLSQSALSQHLTKMREDGLLATRREAQTRSTASLIRTRRVCSRCSRTSTARDRANQSKKEKIDG
jgi:DNA-binding transcriptional ArsR family regulator